MLIGHETTYQTVIYCHVKCRKTYCGLISVANSHSDDLTLDLAGRSLSNSHNKITSFTSILIEIENCDSPRIENIFLPCVIAQAMIV